MERITKILQISEMKDIPCVEQFRETPRTTTLCLQFIGAIQAQREAIGEQLKKDLVGSLVSMPRFAPEIYVSRLISAREIEQHQDFFENCAKDYRKLATELIFALAQQLNIDLAENYPLLTFQNCGQQQHGRMGEWHYAWHGYHCAFHHTKSGQHIEVPLIFGFDFGVLDYSFFPHFIHTTKQYHPFPVEIDDHYREGEQINQIMLALGKFEEIPSSIPGHFGIGAADRTNVDITWFQSIKVR
ncbi:MAG: hypothetical protein E7B59_07535 [Enterobacteriaceae bacterium]|nr:hypothetical protein [Enterobacteriaceae bacterium]